MDHSVVGSNPTQDRSFFFNDPSLFVCVAFAPLTSLLFMTNATLQGRGGTDSLQ